MQSWDAKKGFTLVELSLSIAFIAVLSITVAVMINQTIINYNRGVLLSQINTTGMDLVDEFRYAVQNSSPRSVTADCTVYYQEGTNAYNNCMSDKALNFVSIRNNESVKDSNGKEIAGGVLPTFGAFCTGTYSYIWNSGYLFNGKNDAMTKASLKYKDGTGAVKTISTIDGSPFRVLKVKDELRVVCISKTLAINSNGYTARNATSGTLGGEFDISGYEAVEEEPVDLLVADNRNNDLTIYDLASAAPEAGGDDNSLFYSVSFILGTTRGGINVKATGDYCKPPGDSDGEDFNYCAINKFNFAAQATGETQ